MERNALKNCLYWRFAMSFVVAFKENPFKIIHLKNPWNAPQLSLNFNYRLVSLEFYTYSPCLSTGHCHVSVWRFVPLSVHVYGGGRGSLVRCLGVGAPAPLPERSASPTQVQPLLPPHDGTGQHLAHHHHALQHGRQRDRAERGWHRPGQPRVGCHSGFHIRGD